MKKFLISAIAATICAGFASCSSDEVVAKDNGEYAVATITAQLPSSISRAYADGTTATRLQYAVYDETAEKFVGVNDNNDMVGTAEFVGLETTVTVQIAKAKSYKFYFWADAGEGKTPYTFDYANKQVTVNYTSLTGNNENYDAFYGTAEVAVNGSLNQTVPLVRPFAQLNIGTSDIAAAVRTGFTPANVTVTVNNLYNTFDLDNGYATGNADNTAKFANVAIPSGQTFPVDGYQYLSMNYILVGNAKTTTDVTMTVDNGDGVSTPTATYATVPVQQNYRTNIYGALLTDPANFTVEINPDFNTPDLRPSLYIGEVPANYEFTEDNKTVTVMNVNTTQSMTVAGTGTLVLNNVTINAGEGAALTLAENADVTVVVNGNAKFVGATGNGGIVVPETANLTIKGSLDTENAASRSASTSSLTVMSNGGKDGDKDSFSAAAIGNIDGFVGNITIDGLSNLNVKGYGRWGVGIGGNSNESKINISNTTISYVSGGFVQPNFISDTKYGKTEPEGAPAIGFTVNGDDKGVINLENVTIVEAHGGSKAAAIGGSYYRGVTVNITNCDLQNVVGGNASAAIGGSRFAEETKQSVTVNIANSTVVAQGGEFGPGIGTGYDTWCNGQNYDYTNVINITGASKVTATGGKYGAGIGSGFHCAVADITIDSAATVNAQAGNPSFYKDAYTTAQAIGLGVVDPTREASNTRLSIK